MAIYLVRFGYTSESWAAMIENPQDRRDQLASRIFSLGGRLVGFWYSLGEHDGYALTEYPDAIHGFTLLPTAESRAAMAEIRDFVLQHLPRTESAVTR